MTLEEAITDLKQFITVTISQEIQYALNEFRVEVKQDMVALEDRLTAQIATLSEAVAETMDWNTEMFNAWIEDHETRIVCLEQNWPKVLPKAV